MKTRVLRSIIVVISLPWILASPGVAGSNPCVAREYKVSAIPLRPAGINQAGAVVGTTSPRKAAFWNRQSGLKEINLLPGFSAAEGVALNSSGQMIGLAIDVPTNRRQAFTYKDGILTPLSKGARAFAINNAGVIAGESPGKITSAPVFWKELTPVSLGGCCGGTALAINNRGQIIGNIYNEEGRYHAFLWDQTDGLRQIGPAGDFSSAVLLTDAGDYVLQVPPRSLLFYHDGKAVQLSLAPKAPSHPRAMNRCGAIVGSFGIFADYYRAFAWDTSSGFHDLNSLIPSGSGWKLQEATSINDHGEIVGWGIFNGEDYAGFLLVPLP